jgi:hypothetical protein
MPTSVSWIFPTQRPDHYGLMPANRPRRDAVIAYGGEVSWRSLAKDKGHALLRLQLMDFKMGMLASRWH